MIWRRNFPTRRLALFWAALLLLKIEMVDNLATYLHIGAVVVTTFIVGGNRVGV